MSFAYNLVQIYQLTYIYYNVLTMEPVKYLHYKLYHYPK